MLQYLYLTSHVRNEFLDITEQLAALVRDSGVRTGLCVICSPHTTASITVNEGADPAVRSDVSRFLEGLVPVSAAFSHDEGNSDAHVKASLLGMSETLIIEGGRLLLGTWQAVYFCEFDGPRSRKVAVKIIAD